MGRRRRGRKQRRRCGLRRRSWLLMLTGAVPAGLVKVKQCGLCAMEFEDHNLPGVVSFQAIANLRSKWGAGLPATAAKLRSASARYSSVKLCAFCYQFFYDNDD